MYNVYTLTDGLIGVEESFDDLSSAHDYYRAVIASELAYRERESTAGRDYAETTVHFFDAHEAAMAPIAEYCVTAAL